MSYSMSSGSSPSSIHFLYSESTRACRCSSDVKSGPAVWEDFDRAGMGSEEGVVDSVNEALPADEVLDRNEPDESWLLRRSKFIEPEC
jgi:hypothetical protein